MIKLAVAIGRSAEARVWRNRQLTWSAFVDKLRDPHVTHETYGEYMSMSKSEQGKVKDVGGYVAGYLNGGRRNKASIMYRSALTLDLDFAPYDFWDTVTLMWNCAAALHSTHKHSPDNPRYRLIIPLDRDVTPDEYVAIARRVAATLNIEYFDPTTFDTNRLMFWPSVSKDAEYVFEEQRGEPLSADKVLSAYRDWKNISEWKFSVKVADQVHAERGRKQADPSTKNNTVGHFCTAYDIHAAIEEFLTDVYDRVDDSRYSYMLGSTACGLVTYDDKFAYSHHGTDPASGQLCNAFDLVRIHKFGDLDTGGSAAKSYKAMIEFCRSLEPVRKAIVNATVRRDFKDYVKPDIEKPDIEKPDIVKPDIEKPGAPEPRLEKQPEKQPEKENKDWESRLEIDKLGNIENSAQNIAIIMQNDPELSNRLRLNEFSYKKYTVAPLPWRVGTEQYPRTLIDADYANFRSYIERKYRISAPQKVNDGVNIELHNNVFHPVRDYLNTLEWDGVSRIDTLLIDCFNAEDNKYTREVSRKWMVAAVARVMNPGCKFDNVITLVGEEGTRKSSFFRKLGMNWFSDSLSTVIGKDAYEQLKGKLIIELAELSAFSRADSNNIKHFITKQSDDYRPAYGHETVEHKRQCVFVATSNNRTFLRDQVGNRRFWPISIPLRAKTAGRLDPMSPEFDALIDQFWAEAYGRWQLEERLTLSNEAELIADRERDEHIERDERRGIVEEYLNMKVPPGWDRMTPDFRRDYIESPEAFQSRVPKGIPYVRNHICVAEIWCECFGRKKEELTQQAARDINNMMRAIPGWTERAATGRTFAPYGRQRHYERTS